ncbi:uncharacterized protein PV06_09506 [Exophiala oligosperma]|uniref:Ribosome recycling factor domain-containing protein n=1 Tax=Exophiala oligosperma TaxID=215243 RepID=A0A0D2D826_9EURO|nr:uncharacterized protein PV06_09506 [Exophiala oligosperma]KIW38550.1 hypothetical protein PV06_09506 [Exophiala oligosperma]
MSRRTQDAAVRVLNDFVSLSRRPFTARAPAPAPLCPQCHSRRFFNLRGTEQQPHWRSVSSSSSSSRRRAFATSSALLKKSSSSSKSSRKSPEVSPPKVNTHVPDNAATKNRDGEVDPYDFTDLNAGIANAVARLKDALVRTRDAGRVTPDMIESLPVELNVKGAAAHGTRAHHERTKLGDIASVVQKGGRMLQVYCSEESHVKPISSAVQASQHSLAPQHDDSNPLLINVPVPPVTAETRQQAKEEAKKVYDKSSQAIRNVRGDQQKKFRKMELGKLVIVDELRKAHKQMEDVVKKGQDEAKKVYEAAVKALGS